MITELPPIVETREINQLERRQEVLNYLLNVLSISIHQKLTNLVTDQGREIPYDKIESNIKTNTELRESIKQRLQDIEIIQFVPCGLFEGKNIQQMLQDYVNQTVDTKSKMIIVFANGKTGEEDTVSESMNAFMAQHCDHNIFVVKHIWEQSNNFSMGLVRAVPLELIKSLWNQFELDTNPLIVSCDADTTTNENDDYLSTYLQKLGTGMAGSGGCLYESKSDDDILYKLAVIMYKISRRIQSTSLDRVSGVVGKYIPSQGNNCAFRLENVRQISYDLSRMCVEDIPFVEELKTKISKDNYIFVRGANIRPDRRRFDNYFLSNPDFAFIWDVWDTWTNNNSDGSEGRGEATIQAKDRTMKEIETWFNKCLSSRLLKNYGYKNHKSQEDFVSRCNSYIRFTERYMLSSLKKARIDIPKYEIQSFCIDLDIPEETFLETLKHYRFIEIESQSS